MGKCEIPRMRVQMATYRQTCELEYISDAVMMYAKALKRQLYTISLTSSAHMWRCQEYIRTPWSDSVFTIKGKAHHGKNSLLPCSVHQLDGILRTTLYLCRVTIMHLFWFLTFICMCIFLQLVYLFAFFCGGSS